MPDSPQINCSATLFYQTVTPTAFHTIFALGFITITLPRAGTSNINKLSEHL